MIHLFDKVYITYAEKFVGPQDESRLPEAFARIVDRGMGHIEDRNYDKNLLCGGKNLNEILEKFENENEMFLKFKEVIDSKFSPKFIIYCDESSMLEFLIRWWKFVFPNLDSESAYCLYSNYAEDQTIRGIRNSTFLNISFNSAQFSYQDFINIYWSENKEIFKDKFEKFPAFKLDSEFKKSVCIEFQIINYLVSEKLDKNLEKKLQDFFNKSLIDEITSIIEDVQDNIYQLNNKGDVYFSEDNSAKNLLKNNIFKIVFDKNIKNNQQGFNYLKNNYEFLKICKDLLDLNSKIGKNSELIIFDYPCINYVLEKGIDINSEEILNLSIKSTDNFNILNNLIHKTRLNAYLVPAVMNRINLKGKDSIIEKLKF